MEVNQQRLYGKSLIAQWQRSRCFQQLPQRVQQTFEDQTQLNISAHLRFCLKAAFQKGLDFLGAGPLCQNFH